MIIKNDTDIMDFAFWCVDDEFLDLLDSNDFRAIESEFEYQYPNGIDATELNDIFRFEQDYIAQILGYVDYEDLKADRTEED